MLEDIRKAFEGAVQDLDWMDTVTREKTLTKLHAIRAFVGYPGWIMNASRLDTHYKQVKRQFASLLIVSPSQTISISLIRCFVGVVQLRVLKTFFESKRTKVKY